MFSPEEEAPNGEGWDTEIAKDVSEECSKWGQVMHCHVDKASMVRAYSFRFTKSPQILQF